MRKQRKRARDMEQANLRRTVRTGLRLNQISMDLTGVILRQADLARDLQRGVARLSSMATGVVAASQAQTGGLLELMGRSIRIKAGLLEQASAATQAPSLPESQTRWMDFWMAAFRLAHSNADALARINGTALDSWMRLVQNGR